VIQNQCSLEGVAWQVDGPRRDWLTRRKASIENGCIIRERPGTRSVQGLSRGEVKEAESGFRGEAVDPSIPTNRRGSRSEDSADRSRARNATWAQIRRICWAGCGLHILNRIHSLRRPYCLAMGKTSFQSAQYARAKKSALCPISSANEVWSCKWIVHFIPTGGINPGNLKTYLEIPQVLACGGSWLVPKQLISSGKFSAIARLVKEAVSLVSQVRG